MDARRRKAISRGIDTRRGLWSHSDMLTSGRCLRAALAVGLASVAGAAAAQDRAWIGVAVSDGIDGAPVRVIRVFPDSPAARMGLKEGDGISSVDGRPVRTSQDLVDYVRSRPPGAALQLEVEREGVRFHAGTALGTLPDRYRRFSSGPPQSAGPAPLEWVDIVRDAFGREREQLSRFQEKLGELASRAGPPPTGSPDMEWLRRETEATREQVLRLESLLHLFEPPSADAGAGEFDPRRLILRGGAELGDSIQILLSDPDTGRQFLLRKGDVVHGYAVSEIIRTEQGLLLIRLQKGEEVVELVESGL